MGEKIEFVDLEQVTHFFASDKLTFAATPAKNYAVDYTHPGAGAKARSGQIRSRASRHAGQRGARAGAALLVRRRDDGALERSKHTELTVSRDRVRALKQRLGI